MLTLVVVHVMLIVEQCAHMIVMLHVPKVYAKEGVKCHATRAVDGLAELLAMVNVLERPVRRFLFHLIPFPVFLIQ